MKLTFAVIALAAFATAAPVPELVEVTGAEIAGIEERGLEARQSVGITANEYVNGGCRSVIFFFARGSTEAGNMVRV